MRMQGFWIASYIVALPHLNSAHTGPSRCAVCIIPRCVNLAVVATLRLRMAL